MVKWLSEDQLQIKDEIDYNREQINTARTSNMTNGILVGLLSFGLVAGSVLGITGATLFAVGQTKKDDIINTYMATKEFQNEKLSIEEQKENIKKTIAELEEYYQNGYLAEYEFDNLKKHLEQRISEETDYQLAEKLIENNEDNEFYGILKKNQSRADLGLAFLMPGAGILGLKGMIGLAIGINEKKWGVCGSEMIDSIKKRSREIKYNNMDIREEKKEIDKLKNQYKDLEKRYEELEKEEEKEEQK